MINLINLIQKHFFPIKDFSLGKIILLSVLTLIFLVFIFGFSVILLYYLPIHHHHPVSLPSINDNNTTLISDNTPDFDENENLILYDEGEFNGYASCLLQSLATIIALVATISLVAVQLTASSYSPQIITILAKKKPEIWLVLSGYIALFVVIWIFTIFGPNIFPNIISVFFMMILGVIGLIILIPYSAHVMEILTPSHIIDIVIADIVINKENINNEELKKKFEILVDIILAAIKTYDLSATKHGIKGLSEKITDLIKIGNELKNIEDYRLYNDFYIEHTLTLFDSCKTFNFQVAGFEIIELLETIGKNTVIKGRLKETYAVLLNLVVIGMNLGSTNSEMTFKVIESISSITISAGKKKFDVVSKYDMKFIDLSKGSLKSIIEYALKNNKEYLSHHIIFGFIHSILKNYEQFSKDKNDEFITWILSQIYEISDGKNEKIITTLTEIDILWNNYPQLEEIGNFILSNQNCQNVA